MVMTQSWPRWRWGIRNANFTVERPDSITLMLSLRFGPSGDPLSFFFSPDFFSFPGECNTCAINHLGRRSSDGRNMVGGWLSARSEPISEIKSKIVCKLPSALTPGKQCNKLQPAQEELCNCLPETRGRRWHSHGHDHVTIMTL